MELGERGRRRAVEQPRERGGAADLWQPEQRSHREEEVGHLEQLRRRQLGRPRRRLGGGRGAVGAKRSSCSPSSSASSTG